MKILLAVQGTGNGHISRAREIIPLLEKYGKVDIAISGIQADVQLEQAISYSFYGFSFIFGTHGGVNQWETLKKAKLLRLWKDIHRVPVMEYDLVINDFEPITAWACKLKKIPCIGLSHQSSFLSLKTPRPGSRWNWAELIFKYYAPVTAAYAFHFESYDDFIFTPVIREEIRNLKKEEKGYYTVYLPAFGDEILIEYLSQTPEVKWEVFSKHSNKEYRIANIHFRPIQNEAYNKSLAGCVGLLTGGGFEGPSEALYLGKKVLAIPMNGQWEQQCNAVALQRLGVSVFWKKDKNLALRIQEWVRNDKPVPVDFPNITEKIIQRLMENHGKNG